ncbi:putative glutamate carboxypeptidase 2-like [Hibiscus syriacus]|uniref:Glutamate carboxypeptidase 2-like n=1 Tax=Hibiscus syriacus TaxID=106335 RepID=A0A6A2WEG2_HIBSY|nr:putative glutamate carboxypeptidase 2-like [Hibiscus syriacus]
MEESWKDISMPCLNDHSPDSLVSTRVHNPSFSGMILLDFLATPINNKEPPIPGTSDVSNATSLVEGTLLFGSKPPTPETILSLNSGSDLQFVDSGDPNPAVNTLTKRAPESNKKSDNRRHKRMMKNRESAARSRARKQAYTTELELEVAHLQEENAKLRRQQEKLSSAADQPPKKNVLTRTLTAPF